MRLEIEQNVENVGDEMNTLRYIIAGVFLILCSISDIRTGKIYVYLCYVTELLAIVLCLMGSRNQLIYQILGITPGVFLYLVSIASKEQIGKGDAWIFIVIGSLIGMEYLVTMFLLSLVLVPVIGIPVLLIQKKSLKTKIPFAPFISVAYILMLFLREGIVN